MPETSKNSSSSRPETLRNRYLGGKSGQEWFPEKPHPHGMQLIFKDYDYNEFISTISKGSTVSSDNPDFNRIEKFGINKLNTAKPVPTDYTSIVLPFPRTLSDAQGINNTAFERSFLFERLTSGISSAAANFGEALTGAGNIAKSALEGIRNIGSGETNVMDTLKSAFENIGAGASQSLSAAQYLSRSFLPGDLQGQLAQAGGAIANPLTSLQFTGVDLKNYTFSWDLFPSSQKDSDNLKNIIRILKNKSLPRVGSVANVPGLNRTLLKYPSVVIVNLLGVDETHFTRFKPAMLTNVTVDYGAGGIISLFKGGKPSAVTLSLSFTELNIHTAEDYDLPSGDNNDTNNNN